MERSRQSAIEIGGSMTALVTPFRKGQVDWDCLDQMVDRQLEGGTDWLVALGTTGETPTLTPNEREKLLERVIGRASRRCPVMVGTGSSSTVDAVRQTRWAANSGADAALVAAPSYNRPTQEGLYRHFSAVAESVELPIVLYNVPARTGVDIGNDVVVRLHETYANVVGLKDATGRLDHLTELQRRCDVKVLCGDDVLTWPFMAIGASGVISVLGNLCPTWMKSLVTAALAGRMQDSRRIHVKVDGVAGALGKLGPNPIPIKTAMAIAGMIEEEFRLPLCPLDSSARAKIESILRRHELAEPVSV